MNNLASVLKKLKIALEYASEEKDLPKLRAINNKIIKLLTVHDKNWVLEEEIAKKNLFDAHKKVIKTLQEEQAKLQEKLNNFEKSKEGLSAYHTTDLGFKLGF